MDKAVAAFYVALCAIAVLNVGLVVYVRKTTTFSSDVKIYEYQRLMYYMAFPFVFECCYRAVLPRVDVPRLCFFDIWPNVVLFGRLSAFVGEWCWMLQISQCLSKALTDVDARLARRTDVNKSCPRLTSLAVSLARLLPLLCLLAECFGTAGPVTTNNFYCIVEASIWASMIFIAGLLAVVLLITERRLAKAEGKDLSASWRARNSVVSFARVLLAAALVYVPYMALVNIPLYVDRWHQDEANGVQYLSFQAGLPDVAVCHDADREDWSKWSSDGEFLYRSSKPVFFF